MTGEEQALYMEEKEDLEATFMKCTVPFSGAAGKQVSTAA